MKVTSVKKLENYKQKVYDVVNATPNHNFVIIPHGSNSGVVVHNCGLLDEVEFVPGASVKMEQSRIMRIYRNVKRRMESRYMRRGELPGILFLVSSKKSDMDFLEQYIKKMKGHPNFFVVDEPQWRVKPASNYSGETFPVAVGNKYLPSKVIQDHENVEDYIRQGYTVIDVPVEYRQAFELDVNAALMDIAGISMTSSSKFIYYDNLKKCINPRRKNPFRVEEIVLDFFGPDRISDYLDSHLLNEEDLRKPCFIHIDKSLTGDATGFSMINILGSSEVSRLQKGEIVEVRDLHFKVLLAVAIRPKSGQQVPFHKIREFIYYLRDELGANIQGVSSDSFQSADTLQQLKIQGFETKVISMDRTPTPYLTLRNAINEKRLEMFEHSVLIRELVELEEDKMTGKIDHPINGSKDIADALAGAVFMASNYQGASEIVYRGQDADVTIASMSEESKEKENDLWIIDDKSVVDVVDDDISLKRYFGRVLDW